MIYIYIYMYIHTCMHIHRYYIFVFIYVYIYIYKCLYSNIYIYIYIYIFKGQPLPSTPASWKACVIFCQFLCNFCFILVLFWCHFVSFWCPGGLLATLGLPGAPLRRQGGKSTRESRSWVLCGDPFWVQIDSKS